MSEDKNTEGSQEDSKSERPKVNETISQEQTIEPIETTNPKSEIPKSEIKEMEVHHHPDLHHRKKYWKEYFLEFLMIFLAVTLGFFAENLREHFSDRNKEKIYINGLARDIKADSAFCNTMVYFINTADKQLDTLMYLISSRKYLNEPETFYRLAFDSRSVYFFQYTNTTFEQLKSSGNFGIIHDTALTEKLIGYDNFINDVIKKEEQRWLKANDNQTNYQWQILDATVYVTFDNINTKLIIDTANNYFSRKPVFTKADEPNLLKFYNLLFEKRLILPSYLVMIQGVKDGDKQLLEEIKKKYNVE